MSPEIIAAIVSGPLVVALSYVTSKFSAHKVKGVVEQQFDQKIGQPNGLGSVVSMLEMSIREGRDRSEQLVQHMASDVAQFDRLTAAIEQNHPPTEQLDRMEKAINDQGGPVDGTPK